MSDATSGGSSFVRLTGEIIFAIALAFEGVPEGETHHSLLT